MVAGQKAGRQAKAGDKKRVQLLVPRDVLAQIDREADRRGISRTLFMVSASQEALAKRPKGKRS